MPGLRRLLVFVAAAAGMAFLALPASDAAPVALDPVVVHALPPLPSPESLAALLVSSPSEARLGGRARGESAIILDVIAAIEATTPASRRAGALDEIAALQHLDATAVGELARAASRIPASARERIVRTLIRRQPEAVDGAHGAVLDAIASLGPGSRRAGALELFVTRRGAADAALAGALTHVGRLPSAGDRSRVLVAAARTNRLDGRARAAYLRAANAIPSARERGRALSALRYDPLRAER